MDQSEDMYAVTCQSEPRHTPLVVLVLVLSRSTYQSASFLGLNRIALVLQMDHLRVDGVRCDCTGRGAKRGFHKFFRKGDK